MHELKTAAAEKYAYAQSQMLGCGVGTTDTPRQAPIEAALDDLEVGVKHAFDQLDQLGSRLKPVLQIIAETKADGARAPSSCMLEGRISDLAKGVHELVGRIQSIRAALCI